jgi:amyloid beta precursor protein binding protein 1
VLDASQVGAADLASNFFVSQEWLGKSRALACAALLMELNPDVQGRGVVADAVQLARSEPTSFAQYSLVIATQMDEAGLLEMERACVMCDVPLIVARTNGLLGCAGLLPLLLGALTCASAAM